MSFKKLVLFGLGWLASLMANASGLQVAPTSLTLPPAQSADGLWLSNTGEGVVHAQVRVFRWTQDQNGDQLTPSREVLVSPPMIELAAGDRQLIRVIRTGAPPADAEASYRVVIDELPVAAGPDKGVQFVLRYSVPVFMAPSGGAPTTQLAWKLVREGNLAMLEVNNAGGLHAQLADLKFTNTQGKSTDVHPGLLGYVLPGARMRWQLKTPPAAFGSGGGSMDALINGSATQQTLPPIEPTR
jgi:fimbrial chaperone protein